MYYFNYYYLHKYYMHEKSVLKFGQEYAKVTSIYDKTKIFYYNVFKLYQLYNDELMSQNIMTSQMK